MNINCILPPASKRVKIHTDRKVNEKITDKMLTNIRKYSKKNETEIAKRIEDLNHESDTERFLEANAAVIMMISTFLGYIRDKKWFLLGGAAGAFLLQHALQGWCPPLPILRRLGIRTPEEIYNEKLALKILKGDYRNFH